MLKWIWGMLIAMLLMIAGMFMLLYYQTSQKPVEQGMSIEPKYHLQIIIQNTDEHFWNLFTDGALTASEEYGVYVEFVPVSQKNTLGIKEAVEKGIISGVDGIGLQPTDSSQTHLFIEEAKKKGIEVITYENYNYSITDTPMVGSNSYSIGTLAGDMAVNAINGIGEIAVIMNDSDDEGGLFYRNLIIQGIMESFQKNDSIQITEVYNINKDKFEAEKVASTIISEHKDINLIICLDERSTPGVAQVLVDNNLVGDVSLIGYGIMPQTLDYIKKGVIYGTVCPNAYEIGFNTVKQLTKSLEGEQISDYTNTELYTIDELNVMEYDNEIE